ncbi:hypothetical protein SISNIDRAFT_486115 [Sistotremastrum niveocremeum HHB9708]|uniref:Enhancer of polycomb-like protein n=1 Tax=Sistotremastrum niveocremeum HHB9708 TaxID=1314777 RepID=A0A164UG49_9AGAM|nr:hypothetical protein SISNIDRAFT_486115 [Sistotremastrum niveocremeum HHB9708]
MPRNQQPGTTLRNRNRITNKTRLRVIHGNIEADPLVFDEEEERARAIATAGVEADDANEHHLLEVINAASQRTSVFAQKPSRTSGNQASAKPDAAAAYIPTPDAAGVINNYEELYRPDRWVDPTTYLRFSELSDETVTDGLLAGYTYVMDERDLDWLKRNNQEARGEGTSAQAAFMSSPAGTTTRAGRSAKARGKDPESSQPLGMNQDEFELVMGIFEKATDEKFPFLHVDPSHIAPFSDYESVFSPHPPAAYFCSYSVPEIMAEPGRVLGLARIVYDYWKQRRLERGGRRIMAQLSYDESNENDPYVCFRRRDVKPIRKTRATSTPTTDKLTRLRAELGQALNLARSVLQREEFKGEQAAESQSVWESRLRFVDLKRQYPGFGYKEEEELLVDKERIVKKRRGSEGPPKITLKHHPRLSETQSPIVPVEQRIWPKEKAQKIQAAITDELLKHKEKNIGWEDVVDMPYQPPYAPPPDRLYIRLPATESHANKERPVRSSRSVRMRMGRGGRIHLDRRIHITRPNRQPLAPVSLYRHLDSRPSGEGIESQELEERAMRMNERWKYDPDGPLNASSAHPEDEDRLMLDDFAPRYLRTTMTLLNDEDKATLTTDSHLMLPSSIVDGARFGNTPRGLMHMRRPSEGVTRIPYPPSQGQDNSSPSSGPFSQNQGLGDSRKSVPALSSTLQARQIPSSIRLSSQSVQNGVYGSGSELSPSPASGGVASHAVIGTNGGGTPSNGDGNQAKNYLNGVNGGHMVASQLDAGSPCTDALASARSDATRLRVAGNQNPIISNHPNGLPNGIHNGMNGGNLLGLPHNPLTPGSASTLSPNKILELRQALNPNTSAQAQFPQHLSPPSRPTSNGYQLVPVNGNLMSPLDNMNGSIGIATSNINLRLPPGKAHSRPGSAPTGLGLPSNGPIPNLSGMLRTPSANGHHLASQPRDGSSPKAHMFAPGMVGRSSPLSHPQFLASQSPHGSSPPLAHSSPGRPPQTLSSSPHQAVNGTGMGPAF